VFFPEIRHRREITGYAGDAVLIMDGLSCHESDLFDDVCLDSSVRIELLPAHPSDQLQPCDLGVFVAMKRNVSRVCVPVGLSRQSKQIVKIIGALQTTLLPPTLIHAFAQAGIYTRYCPGHRWSMCAIDASTARCVRQLGANPKVTGRVLMHINGYTVFESGKSISFYMDSMYDDSSSSSVIIGEMKRMRNTSDEWEQGRQFFRVLTRFSRICIHQIPLRHERH
jgi:hypothetical protein